MSLSISFKEMYLLKYSITIKVDISKEFGPSTSGKTTIIASTEGNKGVPGKEDVKIDLNLYKKK